MLCTRLHAFGARSRVRFNTLVGKQLASLLETWTPASPVVVAIAKLLRTLRSCREDCNEYGGKDPQHGQHDVAEPRTCEGGWSLV